MWSPPFEFLTQNINRKPAFVPTDPLCRRLLFLGSWCSCRPYWHYFLLPGSGNRGGFHIFSRPTRSRDLVTWLTCSFIVIFFNELNRKIRNSDDVCGACMFLLWYCCLCMSLLDQFYQMFRKKSIGFVCQSVVRLLVQFNGFVCLWCSLDCCLGGIKRYT